MPRMIDLVRKAAVPSNLMQFAAKGALLVPAPEMVEILVYLATENKVFGEQARLTLAGWDGTSGCEIVSSPSTPKEVLDYFIDHENLRPDLLPLLVENPSVAASHLVKLAVTATREQVETLLASPRVSGSQEVLSALMTNPHLRENETKRISDKLSALPIPNGAAAALEGASPEPPKEASESDSDEVLASFLTEHASEITAENEKEFEPTAFADESAASGVVPQEGTAHAVTASSSAAAAAPARQLAKKWILSAEEQRGSALQKISKLDVKGRINLAFKGTKEERSILIRDGTKIVALAVLESPKITDGEVEKFAGQKNVLEAVLRQIPMKRRFMKMYPVVRNLTFNPRTPIDVSLGLIKNLLVQDLRHLAGNKEVSDTVRKLALKMFRQKLDVTKKGS